MTKAQAKKLIEKFCKQFIFVEDKSMPTHENHPFFVKKAAEAKAFIDRVGLPQELSIKK